MISLDLCADQSERLPTGLKAVRKVAMACPESRDVSMPEGFLPCVLKMDERATAGFEGGTFPSLLRSKQWSRGQLVLGLVTKGRQKSMDPRLSRVTYATAAKYAVHVS